MLTFVILNIGSAPASNINNSDVVLIKDTIKFYFDCINQSIAPLVAECYGIINYIEMTDEEYSLQTTPLIEKAKPSLFENFSIEQPPQPQPPKDSFMTKTQEMLFGIKVQKCSRQVFLNGYVDPQNKQTNLIKNSKYTAFSFLPLVLFEQFHQFINLFYLGLTITQFINILKVGFLIDYLGPLALVVSLSVLKELYDDIKRHKRDRALNEYQYERATTTGTQRIASGDIRVGHIIKVRTNERIPADMVVLFANDEQGNVFIRTDQLDGETDWKLRKAIKVCQSYVMEGGDICNLLNWNAWVKCGEPIENIYQFAGVYTQDPNKESLSLEHAMWANTVLANGFIWGLVIHCGNETRMAMNSRSPQTKFGLLDDEVNYMSVLLFLLMAILSAIVTAFSGVPLDFGNIMTMYIRYLILLSNIIPISMRVNLEFAKLKYAYNINVDTSIEGTITRNSNIPESLGRIQYLLTDKTGTLTQNDMIFKKLSLEQTTFTEEDHGEMVRLMQEQCNESHSPMQDLVDNKQQQRKGIKIRRERDAIYRDLITALAVCHNVTPTSEINGVRTFQASSPDEIALVKIAESVGLRLEKRDQLQIVLKDCAGAIQTYNILNNFPFSSDTKRMGIIVYNVEGDRYIFYLKGADTIMKQFINEIQRGFIDEECENLAREGLRTLVITQKLLTKQDYDRWNGQFLKANERLDEREAEVRKVVGLIENNMEFLGITGVEDMLQEDVCQTLESIRNAGINVWMLTGDKIETAICIAISSGIKSPDQTIFLIKECTDDSKLQIQLNQFDTATFNNILVIDGTSLTTALSHHEQLFITIATKAPAVVCCRCSPTQKAQITECIRKYTKKVTACIGDGGNDVGMIQQADVGIGIEGKEGKQAALASDFSILKFKYLNMLLLWHGRLSYKRSACLSQFVIYRGLIISIIQMVFMFVFYFLSISIFSGALLLGYSTIFTMFPVFSIIFDEDVDIKIALQYPPLYRTLQKGRDLNSKTFMIWVWKATYQGVVIMFLSLVLFTNIFVELETVAFTALIFTQYALTLSELNSIHVVMIISNVASAIVYVGVIFAFPKQLLVSAMTPKFFAYVILIVMVSWLPLYLHKLLMKRLDPSDYEKIMKNVKRQKINTQIFK